MCSKINWEHFCVRWRMWIRPIIIVLYALFVIIIVPLLIVNSVKDGFRRKDQLILIGGLFVLTAIPISIWHIIQHIVHYTKPILQKHIIRVLWMVPIYALNAWLGLIFPEHSIYMDSIRECYEAYVIYNFMVYLLNYLNLEMDLEATLELKPPVKHIFPLCCMKPWEMGREFVHNCKHGILQYTVVRPITTFISVICEICGVYGESTISVDVAYPYILFVNNVSQFIAMYCLVLFYQANKLELRPMKPIPKFLCLKAVVFFSFFQGVIITFLVYFGYIKNIFGSDEDDDYKNLSSKLQDFLICIEMFLAAVAHHYSFPHYPFHINIPQYDEQNGNWYNAFLSMWDVSDVHQDITEHIGVVGNTISRRLRGRRTYHMPRGDIQSSQSETEYLIQSTNQQAAPICYQSGLNYVGNYNNITNTISNKNRYGAFDTKSTLPPSAPATSSSVSTTNPNLKHHSFNEIDKNQKQQNDGINIVKQMTSSSNYSLNYGGGAPPKSSIFFNQNQNSSIDRSTSDNTQTGTIPTTTTTTTSSTSKSILTNESNSTFMAGVGIYGLGNTTEQSINPLKKSDSTASDWLSTPTDDMMGIDVKGIENDNINFKINPNI